ncbi:MAG: methyltransferase [Balneolaceae bacterium]
MKSIKNPVQFNEIIADSFSKSVDNYHKKAEIQKKVAEGLKASILPWKEIIPAGPILEVGCGTGFLSELISEEFPEREFVITDASSEMVSFTKKRIGESDKNRFEQFNVDELENPQPKYSLIVSNFAAQWFSDTAIGLENLSKMLNPGGIMVMAFPGNQSFTEWYECCLELGLPYTANPLPDVEEIVVKLSLNPVQVDYYENDLYQEFSSSIDFFKHIKEIGAGTSISGKQLNIKQLKLLTTFWDKKVNNQIKAKWHVIYLAVKKDML